MRKSTYLILAVVISLWVHKGGNAWSGQEIIPGKQVSGNTTAKTVRPAFRNARDIEKMNEGQLIREALKENKFDVADFRMPDDFGVGLQDNESWHQVKTSSVSSVADAERVIKTSFLKQNPGNYTTDFIGENDYYYEFRLRYTRERDAGNVTSIRIIIYKTSAMFCTFNDRTGYYSEIRSLDRNSVLYLLDLDTFFEVYNWDSARIVFRELEETADEYVYTYYRVSITGGDWDINDEAVLEKIKCGVDKASGIKNCYDDNTVLKKVEIKGTAKKLKITP